MQRSMQLAQRVWNLQPEGGLAGDGIDPSSTMRLNLGVRIRNGDGREQRLGVGVQRIAENIRRSTVLHQVAQVHHAYRVGDMLHHAQVMGDKEICQVVFFLQFPQQVNDLAWMDTSRADTGSSQTTNSGFSARARAMQIRCPLTAGELVG